MLHTAVTVPSAATPRSADSEFVASSTGAEIWTGADQVPPTGRYADITTLWKTGVVTFVVQAAVALPWASRTTVGS